MLPEDVNGSRWQSVKTLFTKSVSTKKMYDTRMFLSEEIRLASGRPTQLRLKFAGKPVYVAPQKGCCVPAAAE